jgi:vancomycin resistance protein YoaR
VKIAGALLAGTAVVGTAAGIYCLPHEHIVGSYSTTLEGRTPAQAANARLALQRVIDAEIPPGEEFSFNRRVDSFSRDRGFRRAPVSYNGQLIDDWGGGVCQTSTTLYNAALLAGLTILERHPHRFSPSYAPPGRDAAVAFSNVDLRFRNPYSFPIRIIGDVNGNRLNLRIVGTGLTGARPEIISDIRELSPPQTFTVGSGSGRHRVRNTGKAGYEVLVYRQTQDRREAISHDTYAVMNRVVEVQP